MSTFFFVYKTQLVLSQTSFVTSGQVALSKEISLEFGRRFQIERERAHLTQEQVARKTCLHVKTISRVENGTPTKRDTVIELAQAIGWNPNEALTVAGYAPLSTYTKPQNPAEFVAALERMGFEMQFSGELTELGPNDLQDLLDDIYAKLLFKTRHKEDTAR